MLSPRTRGSRLALYDLRDSLLDPAAMRKRGIEDSEKPPTCICAALRSQRDIRTEWRWWR